METAQTIFDGKRHQYTCRKALFGEHGAACSCAAPFPVPVEPIFELHVSSGQDARVRTTSARVASAAFEQAKLTAFETGDIVTLYVDRKGAGLVPERRYSGAEHKRRMAARR
jgi:hypothetical protein